MKTRICLVAIVLASVFSSTLLFAQSASLEVTIKNIKGTEGTIRIGLFKTKEDFLKTAVTGKAVKANGTEVKVIFENLPYGDYAISVIHDENGNEKLDTKAMGIPKEGFAFGNNAMGTFGPPSFEESKVKVDTATVLQIITLKYM
ncbi:MAG TPA: DUF2141 domain-containing protein [Chryseolinea sp.]|nr:DUF2141 domain-containing protein [Chryseolinea sp.]HPM31884.1 DUF2141 domain-containing protein [Chryseolinea sp.]